MALNPLATTTNPIGSGSPVPGVGMRPYPQLGPAQGGSMAPEANPMAAGGGEEGMTDGQQDKLATVVRLAMAAGVQSPNDLGNFLKGLGFQTAARLAKPSEPRGITDDPSTGPGGAPMPPGAGPAMPPMGPQGMPPGVGMMRRPPPGVGIG